jgi:hypothetical protein
MAKSTLEKLSQYAVLIIALSALIVSIWQVRVLHRHHKLSVKPYMHSSLIQDDSLLSVYVKNQGFGPAIMQMITFLDKGESYPSLESWLNASGEIKNRRGSFNYGKNSIFAPAESKLLVELKYRELRGVRVRIDYMSIYEEKGTFEFEF